MKKIIYVILTWITRPSNPRNVRITTMTSEKNAQVAQARETFQVLYQISELLNTGLDHESLTICIRLCELGVHPDVIAHIIKNIRKMGEEATAQNKPPNIL